MDGGWNMMIIYEIGGWKLFLKVWKKCHGDTFNAPFMLGG